MREFIDKATYKKIKKEYRDKENCCFIKLNGKKLKNRLAYFEELACKLQLNETFSNNLNAYSDMMGDPYTYYNKDMIIFLIKHYEEFLKEEPKKEIFEFIFDKDVIEDIGQIEGKTVHVYCLL